LRLVEQYHARQGLWRGRRGPGRIISTGHYLLGGQSFAEVQLRLPDDAPEEVYLTAHLCERALQLVLKRFEDRQTLTQLLNRLAGKELPVAFMNGHDLLATCDADGTTLQLDSDTGERLGIHFDRSKGDLQAAQPEILRGFELLLALAQFHILQLATGISPRAALHQVMDLYQVFSRAEQTYLHQVLEGATLDSGNLFSLFLRKAELPPPESSTEAHWRDQQITWLLGQDRVDLPYDRQQTLDVLRSDQDPDEKRWLLYNILRVYDRDLEKDNIARITAEVGQARQQLVFGRMSRAFHNQATLFADAVLLQPNPALRQLADELAEMVGAETPLRPVAEELRLLLENRSEVSLTQVEGACERFEEAVLEAQKEDLLAFLKGARERLEDHADELTRSPLPKLSDTGIAAITARRLHLIEAVRGELLEVPKRHAAYVIISQRPSPTGSHLLAKINEFEEPYLGKSENLRKLVRLAGDRVYSSPDYGWLEVADHWIEAIPLFIKEQVAVVDGQEVTRTVIDIAGMEESFREQMADYWASNISQVVEGEWLDLARLFIARHLWPESGEAEEEILVRLQGEVTAAEIAAVAVLIGALYQRHIEAIHGLVESEELSPREALQQLLLDEASAALIDLGQLQRQSDSWTEAVRRYLEQLDIALDLDARVEQLRPRALQRLRPPPTLHVLTTQSAGMTEGYIRTWLEESMALGNVIAAHGLQEEVEARLELYATHILNLGERIIRELGIWVEVEEISAREQISSKAAVQRVINSNREVQNELSCLSVLVEYEESEAGRPAADDGEIERVTQYLEQHPAQLEDAALEQVMTRNGEALRQAVATYLRLHPDSAERSALRQVVANDAHYRQDLEAYTRFAARHQVLEELSAAHAHLQLQERMATYLRRYQRLAKTTARKEVLSERGLNHLTLHPRYYYQATGANKRYHLLYTPSRVDLGHRERESVETWSQWVGGADRAAARVGRQIYGLINKSVYSYDSLTQPELLKTGENASMASHFAFSNALSLMVTAARHGDIEEMGDQMSRRRDRLIHPAGEGYGGYCVPKDGLFLEFVLTLSRDEKLKQLGVPAEAQRKMLDFANILLEGRDEFASDLDWEQWAATQLQEREDLGMAFQATRIAHVLENLGQPEPRDPYRVTTSLAAQWGIHKMVAGGEHVNRFMPFFKTWLLRQGLSEAAHRHPDLPIDARHGVVVLSAEYKPDTQDGRFSAGMRKFEILAATGAHLLYALDADGQELATLMHEGYATLDKRGKGKRVLQLMNIDSNDVEQMNQLRHLFPGFEPPAEMRLVSPTGLSTQDLLTYTSDTDLERIAAQVHAALVTLGFGETEIEANVLSHGARLQHWGHMAAISAETKAQTAAQLGGRIHALVLEITGPERSYERALQGADVLDTGIPHRQLLALLEDPAHICDLMLEGNPHSALVIVDGASGARRRAMNRLDIMLWFAAGLRVQRQTVYLSIGLGTETVEAWRTEMLRQRRRAERLGQALINGEADRAQQLYDRIISDIGDEQEVQLRLGESEKLHRFDRQRPRDRHIAQALARIGRGVPLGALSFTDFLALGGIFLLDGLPQEEIDAYRQSFIEGLAQLGGDAATTEPYTALLHPRFQPAAEEFRQEKGIESSNKAAEEQPAIALEARHQLAARIDRARALNQRQAAFAKVDSQHVSFDAAYRAAKAALGSGDEDVSEEAYGTFIGSARNALLALASRLHDEDHPDETQIFVDRLDPLFSGRQLDPLDWRAIAGGYEDIGDFGRLAQRCAERAQRDEIDAAECDRQLGQIARATELFYILLAVETTIDVQRQDPFDVQALWRGLADFFAETINDHFYEYRPWVFSRGMGFAAYNGEALYELAVEHHAWLYRYLRYIITRYTEVADLPSQEQDLLLGNFLDGQQIEALGGGGASITERQWRSYGQLRELSFIRNDGFPLPEVFPQFDPTLIRAEQRVNHIIALPVGRTHYSRALREGPTLTRHLERDGRPGANLMITRWADSAERDGLAQPVVQVDNAYFYIDAETFQNALMQHKGLSATEAAQRAASVHPKGINVAAAFAQPVLAALVYPFHGHPLYDSGTLEKCGLPYTVQSLFHTWTTYDKAKYPDIFPPSSAVDTPREIDWLATYTSRAPDESTAKKWIENGLDDAPYPGLSTFAAQHRLVMIKDAAESGGRNAGAFLLRRLDGSIDASQFSEAIDFIYQISLRHNVSIQEVILSSPEYWATEEFMQTFVARQIVDWGSAVDRQRRPRTRIYGSHRIILSTDDPKAKNAAEKWHISHWITLNSKQLITNVGRGGNLEQFLPEFIQEEYRDAILGKLAVAGTQVMEALAAYEARSAATYEAEQGRPVGADLTGVSYGVPRYMMLDFLIAPVFAEEGEVIDIQPRFDEQGQRCGSTFLLRQGQRSLPGTIVDWRVVLIEPNIGVGLWDRVALREDFREHQDAQNAEREVDWDTIGHNARIVLSDLSKAGEQYLQTLLGDDALSS